jgi:ABC-type branched-subunit amino acid transport system ATPase component
MPIPSDSSALVVVSVSAGYGGADVVNRVDLSVAAGEIGTIVGPNGSGKSTLLKAIVGQIAISEGQILLRGRDITDLDVEKRIASGVGYVPQINDVFGPLTVEENLAAGGYLLDKKVVKQRMEEVIEIFPSLRRLSKTHAGRLSGGERKMLAMGRVLMPRPSVLLLDEPTANLAPKVAHEVLTEHVTRLAETGNAVLLVEQRVTEALSVANWAHVLVGGRIRLSGRGPEILETADIGELFLGRAAAASGPRVSGAPTDPDLGIDSGARSIGAQSKGTC